MTEKSIREANNIKAYIRVRPLNQMESQIEQGTKCVDCLDHKQIRVTNFEGTGSTPYLNFSFDHVFDQKSQQSEVYDRVSRDLIGSAFQGINGTIFCYGQTASGKTYTCVGNDLHDQNNRGLLPRLLFEVLEKIKSTPSNIDARAKISIVEIYNEKVTDLLDLTKKNLKLRENKNKGVFIEDVTQKYVTKTQEGLQLLALGIENRSVGQTQMNAASSRSHMIFTITIIQNNFTSGQAKNAKITIIDLAGSEKASKTGTEGKLLAEAIKINTSLSALGNVIHALSENKTHIPYRDSKLTRLLQESLGGNSLTSLIVNISPSTFNQSETVTSLRFAHRAKAIKNTPTINKQYTVEELLILLEKAELRIKSQNKIIQDFTKKKRVGGYGVIHQKSLTLHILKDQDDDSLCDTSSIMNHSSKKSIQNYLSNQKSKKVLDFDVKSQKNLSIHLQKQFQPPKHNKNGILSKKNLKSLKNIEQNNQANLYVLAQSLKCIPMQNQNGSMSKFKIKEICSPNKQLKEPQMNSLHRIKSEKKIKNVKICTDGSIQEKLEQQKFPKNAQNQDEQNLLEDVEQKVMIRSKTQIQLFHSQYATLKEQNQSIKIELTQLKKQNNSLKLSIQKIMLDIEASKNQNKNKQQIILKKSALIEKLKLKNYQRKIEIEREINNLKRFWQNYYDADDDELVSRNAKDKKVLLKESDSTLTLKMVQKYEKKSSFKQNFVERKSQKSLEK